MSRKKRVVYPSDVSDEQWEVLAPLIRSVTRQPGRVPRREIVNAIFYVQRTGCQWRFLPQSYPHWKTVYSCFRRWSALGLWEQVGAAMNQKARQKKEDFFAQRGDCG